MPAIMITSGTNLQIIIHAPGLRTNAIDTSPIAHLVYYLVQEMQLSHAVSEL